MRSMDPTLATPTRVGWPWGFKRYRGSRMPASMNLGVRMVRAIGFVVLALAALVVMVTMGPSIEEVDTATFDRLVDQALSDAEANEARTQGAPQQQVVNGWTNRDLLTAISRQMSAEIEATQGIAGDQRVPALLLLTVLAICWHGATQAAVAAHSGGKADKDSDSVGNAPPGRDSAPSTASTAGWRETGSEE